MLKKGKTLGTRAVPNFTNNPKNFCIVDQFLRPITQNLPSYIKDTTHFLEKINQAGKVSNDTYMVTLDVKEGYSNGNSGCTKFR